ncbi:MULTISPECIES: acetyl-CoA C-acetyltransferase [unclassified Sphingopyxis]|uniref:acetyl-CoA C-acetyltransferase n=1 Tax=unclassified Sphingopyxis TaxID=2614943 RepID=UPI0007305DD1|nr:MULTISPECIES: acetyl-CoA C-acetyltransferase [unclassified Sphingopyxis]KTE25092.1 acetyl-CoA acetyltransferase [Sphingopyxis sp. H057]KTE53661.1 acetyl-CoA acetyltransferase [Sphingopyxis sp. H073]KTE56254.1 acetyl-CoA acetyltransferase [Sphingopyxis sp. H071]KTE61947.1 acetyl-CoA acetyltransferase [Sphingopyxis sp. H107]KTE67220.1 acetyl-CoA acetyltransferase [Sphingopyxis sp. H100]
MTEAYIIDAVRTPRGIGKPGKGALSHLHPQHLAATVLAAIRDRNNLDTATVDDIIWSTSTQKGKQGGDLGRMAALSAGYDTKASGTTLDRFCGGGISTVNFAAATVMSGMEDCVIAGGTEMMSYTATLAAEEANAGIKPLGMGSGHAALDAIHPQSHQGVCGDAIAAREGISREAVDALALESQKRAAVAIAEGRFDKSVVPVLNPDGSVALDREEFPRPETTAEGLAGLKASFGALKDFDLGGGVTFAKQIQRVYPGLEWEGIHHAGNSSGVVDGAAAILLTSKDYADKHGLKPRARVVAYANVGDDPTLMLNAPVPAAKKVLEKAGLTKDDIDVWEINEAFAVVAEKFIRDLDLDREKVNINGGAMALGHPIGATGSILIGTALDELERSGGRYGLVTMCAAGGMAPAIIIERI